MGIPGVNINPVTSAMSRIIFEQNGARRLGSNAQPAPHHQPGQPPDLRQRDLPPRPAHLQGGRQRHLPHARDPERRHHGRRVLLQPEPDLQLRGQSRPAARSTPAPASTWRASCSATRGARTARMIGRGHLHGEAAGVGALPAGRLPGDPEADRSTWACAGTCSSPGSRTTTASPTSTPRRAGWSSPPTTRSSTASRSVATCRPTPRARTSAPASASPTT